MKANPPLKRPRCEEGIDKNILESIPWVCRRLLSFDEQERHPRSLHGAPIGNDVSKLLQLLSKAGFRTSIVKSPREAVSVYKDSIPEAGVDETNEAMNWLALMFGLHHRQDKIEAFYRQSKLCENYQLLLFYAKIRQVCSSILKDRTDADELACEIATFESFCASCTYATPTDFVASSQSMGKSAPSRVTRMINLVVARDARWRPDQLQHEWERIQACNCTLSNALIQIFVNHHGLCIRDIFWKASPVARYERITIYLYDPSIDEHRPSYFLFQPSLKSLIDHGPESVSKSMVTSFWGHLLRGGYYAAAALKEFLREPLQNYFMSGICEDNNTPTKLNAHFTPSFPLAIYLHGAAGAGKSSLSRHLPRALFATIHDYIDPEINVRSVKQNLNKPIDTLRLEMDLRANNNDLSVMSIIQGRRLSLTQTKPGLVVLNLEEMPHNVAGTDPRQLDVCQLVSQRFAGRKGDFHGRAAPRNSDKRGISGDCSIIPVFTSNYVLVDASARALEKLAMFSEMVVVPVSAVTGSERFEFAKAYLRQCICDRLPDSSMLIDFSMDAPLGKYERGDVRALVRFLRVLAFYASEALKDVGPSSVIIDHDSLKENGASRYEVKAGGYLVAVPAQEPVGSTVTLESRPLLSSFARQLTRITEKTLRSDLLSKSVRAEVEAAFVFWRQRVLAPTVIVAPPGLAHCIAEAASQIDNTCSIWNINPSLYKMQRSLYDSSETPNVRDDILAFVRGSFVVAELICNDQDSQLCIREMIEDSPSLLAFSSEASSLKKDGLLFVVSLRGKLTPEIASRASIIVNDEGKVIRDYFY